MNQINKVIFLVLLLFWNSTNSYGQIQAQLVPKQGLIIETKGLQWGVGSTVNYVTQDKRRHYYYFSWWEQDVDSSRLDAQVLLMGSENTAVSGNYELTQTADKITTTIKSKWRFPTAGFITINFLRLWEPYFKEAVWLNAMGQPEADVSDFNGNFLVAQTPFGQFKFTASHPFSIQRNSTPFPSGKAYNKREQWLEILADDVAMNMGDSSTRWFSIERLSEPVSMQTPRVKKAKMEETELLWQPAQQTPILLPLPKRVNWLSDVHLLKPVTKQSTTAERQLAQLIGLRWQTKNKLAPVIRLQHNRQLPAEAYTLKVKPDVVVISFANDLALQHALQRCVQLLQFKDGQLVMKVVDLEDEPALHWRGIHQFTGPTALNFHRQLYDKVLLPLFMNQVVLQLEQAKWASRPELHHAKAIDIADLKKEFAYLRQHQIEPIPLIQSLGHMEWFFKPKQNRHLAVNPQYPYTLNPELPEAQTAITQIWDETFKELAPKIMHIGFDEIGMIGFQLDREKEVDFFRKQIQYLYDYGQKRQAKLMLWGDMGLAPGEAPDACNGDNPERAATIRNLIPKGSIIADWHYLDNPNPEVYLKPLRIWKNNGTPPIASPWASPENIRGFALAANQEGAGLLQTTWADFESSEVNMLLNMEQFGAYVLAMDYAWSGRRELPNELPYDPVKVFAQLFYRQPLPLHGMKGLLLDDDIWFGQTTASNQFHEHRSYTYQLPSQKVKGWAFNSTTAAILKEGELIASVEFKNKGKVVRTEKIRYAVDVRAAADTRFVFRQVEGVDPRMGMIFFEEPIEIDEVKLIAIHPGAGWKIDRTWLLQ